MLIEFWFFKWCKNSSTCHTTSTKKKMNSHHAYYTIIINHDQLWSLMINHDQSWIFMFKYDQSWSVMISYDQSWSVMTNYHRKCQNTLKIHINWCRNRSKRSKVLKTLRKTKDTLGFSRLFFSFLCFSLVCLVGRSWAKLRKN